MSEENIEIVEEQSTASNASVVPTEATHIADASAAEDVAALKAEAEEMLREIETKSAELEKRKTDFEAEIEAKGAELASKQAAITAEREAFDSERAQLEKRISDISARELSIKQAEFDIQQDISEKKRKLEEDLFAKRQECESEIAAKRTEALASLEKEISELRAKRLGEIDAAEESERTRVRGEISREREEWDEEKSKRESVLASEREEIEKMRGVLSARMDEINRRNAEFQDKERDLEEQEERMRARAKRRSERLDEEAERLASEYKATIDAEKAAMAEENSRLRSSLRTQQELLASFEQLQAQLGGQSPEAVLLNLNSKTEEIRALREELASRPTDELKDRYEAIARSMHSKDARIEDLERKIAASAAAAAEVADLRRQIQEAQAQSATSDRLAKIHETAAKQATAELEKIQADFDRLYGTPAGEDERRKEIEMPYILRANAKPAMTAPDDNEIEWLDNIYNKCESYGLHFNRRLLTAFHTSLKTAEWAPLTVLAGVSGTGKSELPRLYSHFGGLYFAPVSVQPNWDSQESMLGFFNSIDNRFDAQPVLNFLAQTQKTWESEDDGYPGLSDAMSLILLDEMNLAHPELYFAEFLSKLELRRGTRANATPMLDVKIGSGMKPYKLPLGRNVLWVGTMNQDETTKSLSDKVLDRSIVMHFPRPTELKRRQTLEPLDDGNRGAILSKCTWSKWCQMKSTFNDEEIRPYKEFIEEMNASLGVAGRAIGHRVWQSVEYYMSNYPEVLAAEDRTAKAEAMHIAFEDQLVQKVMPKLRGIDTRGKSKTECLDKIREQLITGIDGNGFDLTEDFDQSCELGYGQFIWQSANYLKEDNLGSEDFAE